MEQIYKRREIKKQLALGYARKCGWSAAAIAYKGDAVRGARCQSPDVALYRENFDARRAVR